MVRIVGVFSGKGGVGKTTCTVNIAAALHKWGEKVMLMDCNFENSNLGFHLGLYDFHITVHDVLEQDVNVLEAVHIHQSGLRIIPSSIPHRRMQADPSKLRAALEDLDHLVLFDGPPGIGQDVVSLLGISDDIIVVTNPEIPAVADALKLIAVARELNKGVLGVVVNRVSGRHELSIEDIEKVCHAPVLGVVPEDRKVKESLFAKTPLVWYRPHAPAALAFKKIGAQLVGRDWEAPALLPMRRFMDRWASAPV